MEQPTYRDCEGCRAMIKTEVKRRIPVAHTCGRTKEEMLSYVQKQKEIYDYNVRKSFYYNVYWKKVKGNIDDHKLFPDPALDKIRSQSEKKILIIGQALPAVAQAVPYDTTMLYTWFDAVGINQQVAQSLFDFDAVFGQFPGFDESGGHLKPTYEQMSNYFHGNDNPTNGDKYLVRKVTEADKIIILGNVARDFFRTLDSKTMFLDGAKSWLDNKKVLYMMHPSKRNYAAYKKNQENLHRLLKELIEQ